MDYQTLKAWRCRYTACLFSFDAPDDFSFFRLKMHDYGRASVYDFDNPQKWVTVESVPLLDEHEMTNDKGEPIAFVDKNVLEEIAENNNRKVRETGDPATLILGHTSDDPRAEEKPAKGFAVNYHVKPFKRDEATGRVIYAIHGDFKVRPKNAALLEEYPRRSVELWWHKKDIDPIALLGGSSPERDLGVVLRHARLNHVSIDRSVKANGLREPFDNSREGVIQFSSRGQWSIETYTIDAPPIILRRFAKKEHEKGKGGKVEKVMHEFKHGELHSGSKSGPKVTSRRQAIAIAMSESGQSKNGKHKGKDMAGRNGKHKPKKMGRMGESCDYGREESSIPAERARYADGLMDTDDYDGGDEAVPTEDEDFDSGNGAMPGGEHEPDESDPVLAKVFQSKQWNELSSKIDMILQALEGGGEAGAPGMGAGGMPGEEGVEEMPPPGAGAPGGMGGMGQAPPPGAEAGGDEYELTPEEEGGGGEPEEDERRMHGEKPVQMAEGMTPGMRTGMPGPSSARIPNFEGARKQPHSRQKMSRQSSVEESGMNGNAVRRSRTAEDRRDKVIRDLRIRLARMQAEKDIAQLEGEGIVFGRDPQQYAKIKKSRTEELTLAYLHDEDSADDGEPDTYVADKIDEMRTCYQRRKPDPARRGEGPARYARTQTSIEGEKGGGASEDDDNFEDELGAAGDYAAINEFGTLLASGKTRQDAIKFCRKKYGIGR